MNSLAVLLLVGFCAAASAQLVDVHNGNANEYADEILKNLRIRIINQGLDPLVLPVKSYEFSKKVLLVEIRGSAKIYDGYLGGLSTIKRTGLASMQTNATHVRVRATIGVNDLKGSYKASAKFMNIGPKFGISLEVDSIGITFEVVQALQQGSRPVLLSFAVVDLGHINAQINGDIKILDFFINKFNNFVINIVKNVVADVLSIPLKKLVQDVLNTVDLPDLTASR